MIQAIPEPASLHLAAELNGRRGGKTKRSRLVAALAALAAVAVVSSSVGCSGGEDKTAAPPKDPVVAKGLAVVEAKACLSCHSTDGSAGTGPTWKGLAGSEVPLADGRTVTADRPYLRRSILEPDAEIVKAYPPGVMSSTITPGSVTPEEADAVVAYIETLK